MARRLSTSVLLTFALTAPAMAQPVLPPMAALPFASGAEIAALEAKAKAMYRGKPNPLPIVAAPPYRAYLEYRGASTPASVHEDKSELLYVIDGSGSFVLGGTLKDEKRTNAANLSGSGINGGTTYALAKGTFLFVPPNTAHFFASVGADGLTVMTLYVPKQP